MKLLVERALAIVVGALGSKMSAGHGCL